MSSDNLEVDPLTGESEKADLRKLQLCIPRDKCYNAPELRLLITFELFPGPEPRLWRGRGGKGGCWKEGAASQAWLDCDLTLVRNPRVLGGAIGRRG